MKPLISYYGGKQRMSSKIVPLIPPHTVYCEPFAGGAAVFYAKPEHRPSCSDHYREVLNDINGDLVNMYMVARRSPESFSQALNAIPFSVAVHRGARSTCGTDEERALAFFVNNQQSFGNISRGGWQRGTFGRNLSATWASSLDRVRHAAGRLRAVSLDSIDAISCIKKWDSPQTFFYVDPPYLGSRCDGMGKWSDDDLDTLISTLNDAMGSFIVSGYGIGKQQLNHSSSVAFSANCTATGAGKTSKTRNHGEQRKGSGRERIEKLWMRGPTKPIRSSLVPVLEKQQCFGGPLLGPYPLPIKHHIMSAQARDLMSQETPIAV